MTKPFSNRELLARVKAHLRRTETIETAVAEENASSGSQELTIGNLQILPDAFIAKKHGQEVELTHREFELLHHLANHIGQVMTREHLLETVWGYDYFGDVEPLTLLSVACAKNRGYTESSRVYFDKTWCWVLHEGL